MSDDLKSRTAALVRAINAQDNRITASPYFYEIHTVVRIFAKSEDEFPASVSSFDVVKTGTAYQGDDGEWMTEEEARDLYEHDCNPEEKSFEEHADDCNWESGEYIDAYEVYSKCGPFFTEKGARAFIYANAHHLNNPRTYVRHAWRNPEIALLMDVLQAYSGETIIRK